MGGDVNGGTSCRGNVVEGRYTLQLDGNILRGDVLGGGVIGRHHKGDIASGDNAPCNGNIPGGGVELVAGRHHRGGVARK